MFPYIKLYYYNLLACPGDLQLYRASTVWDKQRKVVWKRDDTKSWKDWAELSWVGINRVKQILTELNKEELDRAKQMSVIRTKLRETEENWAELSRIEQSSENF